MRILLTHGYFLGEDPKEQQIMRPYPPLGIQCISAYLLQHQIEHEVFDTTFNDIASLRRYILEYRPRILALYVNLMTRVNILSIVNFVRSSPELRETIIIIGGPESRHHREHFLKAGVDIAVLGEGEQTMLELVKIYSRERAPDLSRIDGIAFKDRGGNIQTTGNREFIADLDTLPFPARHKIDYQPYFEAWSAHHGMRMLTLNTMRGCPYGCKWCSRAVYGKSYRRRSPSNVVDEIQELQQNYEFDNIWFVDDVFTINPRWMREFTDELENRQVQISYEAISRADRMNEEIVALLKKSGCFRIWIGAESGSQSVLDAMNRMVKVEQVKEAIRLSKEQGLETGTFLMLGYPGESEKDIRATLNYLVDAQPEQFTITIAYPIKGTELYTEVESRFIDMPDWSTSNDRDINFERAYRKQYYHHAIAWIQHSMAASKLSGLVRWKHELGKWKGRLGMEVEKLRTRVFHV